MSNLPLNTSLLLAGVLAYLIGGLPFGYLFVRFSLGKDVRTMGSGNIGATNVHRTAGRKAGLIVLVLDIAKGLLAVWVASLLTNGAAEGLAVGAVGVMLGHCYPVFLRFKGGKAVACFIGAFLYITPLPLAVVLVIFLAVVAMSKFISLGSIVAASIFPFVVWLMQHPAQPILIAAIVAGVLMVYRHKANISRLMKGKENVFSLQGGRAS